MARSSAKPVEPNTVLLVGGKDIGKSSLKKSLKKALQRTTVFLDTDEDGDEDDRNQFKILLKSADVVVVAVGSYISKEDCWMIETALDKNKDCCLVRPKANVVTDTWCERLYDKGWEELEEHQKDIVVKVVRCTHQDDKERIRKDFSCKDLPIFLVNSRTLATSRSLPVDYDAEKLIHYLKK